MAFLTEIRKKVLYATREESKLFSPSVKLHKIILFSRFQFKKPYSYTCHGACEIDYFKSIDAQLDLK